MTLLLIVIVLALIFDFINGFHDSANSIATIVSTKVLTPFKALLWAAFFNAVVLVFCKYHFLGFELKVADTVAKIVKTDEITLVVIMAGLIAAIAWNLLTWYFGIPSSSSHTLLGGFAGAAIAKAGFGVLADVGKIYTTFAFIFLAPFIGMFIAYILSVIILHLFKRSNPSFADKWFRRLQLLSSAAFSLGHGSNDAQKVMGIIAAALIVFGISSKKANTEVPKWAEVKVAYHIDTNYYGIDKAALIPTTINGQEMYLASQDFFVKKGKATHKDWLAVKASDVVKDIPQDGKIYNALPKMAIVEVSTLKPKKDIAEVPEWAQYACFFAIALGTLSGGWKIIKTMGTKITKVTPFEGVAAESAGALTLYITQALGIPVSTTHTIMGSIIGTGLTNRVSAIRWGLTINILWAWVLTIPVSAVLGALLFRLFDLFIK
jgi:PiT family inorganic phosphate transporter